MSVIDQLFSKAKMGSRWTGRKVHNLISIWADERIQALLELAKGNKAIFGRIAEEMGKAGYKRIT